jgi:hypothetical protein
LLASGDDALVWPEFGTEAGAHHEYGTRPILNIADQSVVTDMVAPRARITLHRLADATGITDHARCDKGQDSVPHRGIEPPRRFERRAAVLNLSAACRA